MLTQQRILGFVPVSDLQHARAFYIDVLGLEFDSEDDFALVVRSGETRIRLVKVATFSPAPFTILGWEVDDVAAEVAALSARGVEFARFEGIEQDELGIWIPPGGGRVAWFRDIDGNMLSLSGHVRGDS